MCVLRSSTSRGTPRLRSDEGQTFANYHGAQFGARRLYTVDGKIVLAVHSLFTVVEFALDRVMLSGAHPPDVKGKYVDVTLAQWDVMFKIVTDTRHNHESREARAVLHHNQLAMPTPSTHPNCLIVSAMHIEPTSNRNNRRTNTVFDVRGRAAVLGDFTRGCEWPDTDQMVLLRVTKKDLSSTNWFVPEGVEDTASHVCSMTPQHWGELEDSGFWQTTSCLHKQCMRVVGFIRVEHDEADTPMAREDPFFTVVHVLDGAANPDITKLPPDSPMLLLPRHSSGQPYFVTSDLPATLAIEVMRRFADQNSRMILVRVLVQCLRVY